MNKIISVSIIFLIVALLIVQRTHAQANSCLIGDANQDGIVSLTDFAVWRQIYLSGVVSPSPSSPPSTLECPPFPGTNTANTMTYNCRLFADNSPWNTPIASTATVDPASAEMVTSGNPGSLSYAFAQEGAQGFDIQGTDYGVPLYYADGASPKVNVMDKFGWWAGFTAAPMPTQATPAVGTDHHMVIWDVPNKTLYEYWDMNKNTDGSWTAGYGIMFPADGTGYQAGAWLNSARAYGGSAVGGIIRYEEMKAGEIKHALSLAYPYTRGKAYARGKGKDGITDNIASHSDNQAAANRNTPANIPEGARLRLKATVDIAARCGTKQSCVIIATALKKYGAYMVDTSGKRGFMPAEVLAGKNVSWSGVLSQNDIVTLLAEDFEIMSLPNDLTSAS